MGLILRLYQDNEAEIDSGGTYWNLPVIYAGR
jgi:hypothetical protein